MIVIDMDMPESCSECPLFDDEYLCCQKTKEQCETWEFKPTKSCPIKCDIEQIRAELHATAEMHEDGNYYLRDKWVDEIIGKYAEQEPKTGKWKFVCQHWRKCSECGFSHKFAEGWDYCPNCGAKMKRSQT